MLLVNIVIFSLPPSQFGGFAVVICCHTNKMWFTPRIWLSVKSRSDLPKLRVFALFQLQLLLALLYANV